MTELIDVNEPVKEAVSTAPETEPSTWGAINDDFTSNAPDVVKDLIAKKGYDNLGKFFDSYVNLEKMKGGSEGIVIPSDDNPDGWGEVWNQLGRPETHDKYEITYDGDIPLSDDLTNSFKQFAHGMGLSQKQFNDTVAFQLDAVKASEEAYAKQVQERQEENVSKMQEKWKDKYDVTFQKTQDAAEKLGVLEFFKSRGLDTEPEVVNMLLTIANSDSEDSISTQTAQVVEKSDQEQLEEIMKSEAFLDKFHKKHKETMATYMEINRRIANSGQSMRPRT